MPSFSLIVATVDRALELERLLGSLRAQSFKDFEIIIIDQNLDDRVVKTAKAFEADLAIRLVKSVIRNTSHARNLGMKIAGGDIFAFPDDDCLYPPDTLRLARERFDREPAMAFLTGPSLAPEGHLGPGRWQRKSCRIDDFTVWTALTEFNFFVRADWVRRISGFDESFGLGARFGSAEGIDMGLRLMAAGGVGYYDYDLKVNHIDRGLVPFTVERAFRYGTGLGQALRKHTAPLRIVATFIARPMGGILINLARRRRVGVAYHWQTLLGRLYGLLYTDYSAAAPAVRLKSTSP